MDNRYPFKVGQPAIRMAAEPLTKVTHSAGAL
jgi:hypothetical protein